MRAPPDIKGLSFINRHAFLEERFGEAGLQQVLAALKPETAQVLRTASALDWVPLQRLIEVDLAIVEAHFGGDLAAGRVIGEYNLNRAVSKVYRVLMRLFDTTAVIKRATAIWEKIIRGARVSVRVEGPRHCFVDVHDLDPLHPLYCEVLAGGLMGVLHAAGEQQVRCDHPQCVLRGAPTCVFELRW